MMNKRWARLAAIVLGISMLAGQTVVAETETQESELAGYAVDENGEPYLLGYVTNETSSGWTAFAMDYLKATWEAMGGEFVSFVSDYDLEKETAMINDLKEMNPDAILVHPSDSYAIAPAVQSAMDDGFPVFAVDMGVIGADVSSYISQDQTEMGRNCGEYIASQFSEENPGKILVIAGGLEQNGAQQRQAGFEEALADVEYCEIVQTIDTGWSSDKAYEGIQDAFERDDSINAIYTHSDFMMQGIIEGLRARDKLIPAGEEGHIVLASIDADSVGLQNMKDGYVDMEAENSPLIQMAVTINTILSEIKGADYESEYIIPVTTVTTENMNDESLWGNYEKAEAMLVEQDYVPMPE